jgi:hypothetical protein
MDVMVTCIQLALENIKLFPTYKILEKPNQGLFVQSRSNMKNISKVYRSSYKCK